VEKDGQIDLVFVMDASFDQPYTVLQRNLGISKIIHFPLELLPELRTQKTSPRHIDRRNVSSTELEKGGRSQRDKLNCCPSTIKLTIPPSFDARPLV